jgi:hypothetical protein
MNIEIRHVRNGVVLRVEPGDKYEPPDDQERTM